MRAASLTLTLPFLALAGLSQAQEPGVALNMGRGLDNGGSINWTFKENWTLRPTIGAGYSQQTGFQASIGSTLLRSFGYGHRVYGYVGAGLYYGAANVGRTTTLGGPVQGGGPNGSQFNSFDPLVATHSPNVAYLTTPFGLRGQIHGNVEAFAEAAYQRTLSGRFGLGQTGQFYGNGAERFGATFGISLRLN